MAMQETLERMVEIYGEDRRPLFELIAGSESEGYEWYLQAKIIDVADSEERLDNDRALKYAYNFCKAGASVTFLKERGNEKTPDLLVEIENLRFFMEVKKFRMKGETSSHPVSKVVDAVTSKRTQLPPSELGFVALDNFDISIESRMTHENIFEALTELDRASSENPAGWQLPGGVIFAACTLGGVVSSLEAVVFPHFIWLNQQSQPLIPAALASWIAGALPGGEVLHPGPEAIANDMVTSGR